jgi:DnaJ-class molecular chaperone
LVEGARNDPNGQVFRRRVTACRSSAPDERGDLYATVEVQLPRQLTPEERTHFEALQKLAGTKKTSVA